ncbi:hypothetical protein CCR95_11025 [Thiocystis minor]|uniref:hypothetical protein n=1 Tax=Thiocystis minor TaxID=61597 RepID=UPI0019131F94|nr:hypothetical protein [Thiocystis minor]MBK5964597.1 hypothetical protein [Thiocystis minor]
MTAVSGLKSASRERRNQMLGDYLDRLEGAAASGRKVVYTFVPGNLIEILLAFGILPIYPEILALQAGIRGESARLIEQAETGGYDDVCSYVGV